MYLKTCFKDEIKFVKIYGVFLGLISGNTFRKFVESNVKSNKYRLVRQKNSVHKKSSHKNIA